MDENQKATSLLRADILVGYKSLPDYALPIIGPTPEEWALIVKRQEEEEKKEKRQEIFDIFKFSFLVGFSVSIMVAIPLILLGLIFG